jgi:hypothetical protein
MHKHAHIVIVLSAALLLAACQQEAPTPAPQAATGQPAAPASANTIAAVANPLLSITPANMNACDPAVAGTVKWDVRSAHPESATVSIYAGTGPAAKLFVTGGASGEAQTGPWVRPGSQFQLKDQATGKDLGQITVGGPKCS